MSKTAKFWTAIAVVAVFVLLGLALYALGQSHQQVSNVKQNQQAQQKGNQAVKQKARADIQRAAATGQAREQDRAALDTFFEQLDKEAADAPTAAGDHYVLPDERLQLWRAANAGRPDHGAAPGQPDGGTEGTAPAADRADPGPGDEPQGGGEGIPPAGVPVVPAAAVPAVGQ